MEKQLPEKFIKSLEELRKTPTVEEVKHRQIVDLWSNGFPIECLPWFDELKQKAGYKGRACANKEPVYSAR